MSVGTGIESMPKKTQGALITQARSRSGSLPVVPRRLDCLQLIPLFVKESRWTPSPWKSATMLLQLEQCFRLHHRRDQRRSDAGGRVAVWGR